jgi:hypothetical protein
MKDVDGNNEDYGIMMCKLIARQRLAKHISAEANARYNKTFIARQRHSKHSSLTIKSVFCVVRAEGL